MRSVRNFVVILILALAPSVHAQDLCSVRSYTWISPSSAPGSIILQFQTIIGDRVVHVHEIPISGPDALVLAEAVSEVSGKTGQQRMLPLATPELSITVRSEGSLTLHFWVHREGVPFYQGVVLCDSEAEILVANIRSMVAMLPQRRGL